MNQEKRQAIRNWIDEYKKENHVSNYELTHGYCLAFAKDMVKKFKGDIFYIPSHNHFVVKYDDRYWDGTGAVTALYTDSKMISIKDLSPKVLKHFTQSIDDKIRN